VFRNSGIDAEGISKCSRSHERTQSGKTGKDSRRDGHDGSETGGDEKEDESDSRRRDDFYVYCNL
jgi:hypothetical protein